VFNRPTQSSATAGESSGDERNDNDDVHTDSDDVGQATNGRMSENHKVGLGLYTAIINDNYLKQQQIWKPQHGQKKPGRPKLDYATLLSEDRAQPRGIGYNDEC